MPVSREEIYEALFALVNLPAVFPTAGRRLQSWTATAEQPAIFLRTFDEDPIPPASFGVNPNLEMTAEIFIYCQNGPPDTPASTAITDLIDVIDAVFTSYLTPDGRQTLGGRVFHAWRAGKTLVASGEPQTQSVAIIPVVMLVRDLIVPRPKVLDSTSPGAPASLAPGAVLPITVQFNTNVTVAGGRPSLALNSGGTATLLGAVPQTGNALTFQYVVGLADSAALLEVTGFTPAFATIVDQYGKAADMSAALGTLPQAIAVSSVVLMSTPGP
jgi:hypothetical protein